MKKQGGFLLRLTVSLLAMGGLVYALRGKLGEAFSLLKQGIAWEWFILALIVYLGATAVISWRLKLVFQVQKVKVKFLQAVYLSLVGLFFNLFFPSALGGDIAKGYFAYQYSGKKLGSFTGVVLDRLLGFVTIVLIALAAVIFYSRHNAAPLMKQTVFGALAFLVFGIVFFSSHRFAKGFQFLAFLIPSAKWRENLASLYHAIREYGSHKGLLFFCIFLSFAGQVVFLVDVYFLSRGLGLGLSPWPFFLVMPLVAFMSMAPSLSGLGVREAGFVFFFKSMIPAEQAFALSLLFDLLYYGCALAAGLMFAFKGGLKPEVLHGLQTVGEKYEGAGK